MFTAVTYRSAGIDLVFSRVNITSISCKVLIVALSFSMRSIIYMFDSVCFSLCGNGFARWLFRYASYYCLENLHSCWQVCHS
uniref:Uncharacterized protein n=1 Tax=Brassica campestris TaxID=3711 RepID=A0A3P6AES3_BRACM|nr:unnamed protein product [Brassica rapa]